MKDTRIKIKNNLQGINSRVNEAKNQISNLEYKEAKNNQCSEQQEQKRIKNIYRDTELVLPMYNVHPYFSLKNLGKKACIIQSKIW